MLTTHRPKSFSTTVSSWWRSNIDPVTARVTQFSTKNRLVISTTAAGLSAAGFFFPPLYLLAAPSIVFATLPAYAKMVQDWQREQGVGEAAIESTLITLFVATNHFMIGAAGVMMLAAGRSSNETKEQENPLTALALGTLALPVAGLSGAAAALYATIARNSPRHATGEFLRQHNIFVRDWLAARKLPKVEVILLDQSCLMEFVLHAVHPFNHRLAEDVAWYALSVVPTDLQRHLRADYPELPSGSVGTDVQLLTPQQLRLSGLTAQAESDSFLYVVVNQQVIGALEVERVSIPAARQLLVALRQLNRPIILLAHCPVAETEALMVEFDLSEGHANMGWQQKVDFCRAQQAACFISRDVPSAAGLVDVAVTLSADDSSADIVVDDSSFGMLTQSLTRYTTHQRLRHIFTAAPTVVTIGGVFFLQWGMPAAIAVQGASTVVNRLVDWRLKPKTGRSTPAPAPPAAMPALAV